ncbi:hypothetical protein TPHA_0E01600 [Tetrapisispora phaffii CBS 4417]|uniref:Pyruvate decarboxylase n=1 Tax=Tetrapisispora phaffii (strain ATCC 24235 / CBS 4417 / NBRC 1672 / NRRL Y-8282 / UCD 70-5) TaxID=1071381 RepID=G8BTM5_TETPH|nr:hypothetical protein TPHA_0E01600 [Tetrapisispora phaffii CBS 4417]CCE63253.1 hypothetical protein TPHA_0E01600 [Tetrapisispora phaffii CBS 4417]
MAPVLGDVVHSDTSLSDLNEHSNKMTISSLITSTPNRIPFGKYIFRRLQSCGTKSVFGVPGDYNLNLLEQMYDEEDSITPNEIQWIGCCNELNAAYAADGYSRYTNKIGCLITTYGVGELSAINGIAGAFTENVKLLHIVGVVSQDKMKSGRNFHHLIPNKENANLQAPNYQICKDMIDNKISCSTKFLDNIATACDDFDDLLRDIFKNSKPGFLFIPEEFSNLMVSDANLFLVPKITLEDSIIPSPISYDSIDRLTQITKDLIYQSKRPAIIGDILVDRFGGTTILNELIQNTGIWNFSTIMGKSIINEANENYIGLFSGDDGKQEVNDKIRQCDLILHFGIDTNEVNSGVYTLENYYPKNAKIIEFHSNYIKIKDNSTSRVDLYKNLNFIHVLKRLNKILDTSKLLFDYPYISKNIQTECSDDEKSNKVITQDYIKDAILKLLNPGDILLCDTGTFQFSVRDYQLPPQVKYISQSFYLSIGMALPASLGVGIGMKDYPNIHIKPDDSIIKTQPKLILCEGDGAAQMTIQEISTLIRYKIPISIFLWNNDGYTIERAIRGPTRDYNDIQPWNWTMLIKSFETNIKSFIKTYKVTEQQEFKNLLTKIKQNNFNEDSLNFIEVQLGRLDVPHILQDFMDRMKKRATAKALSD